MTRTFFFFNFLLQRFYQQLKSEIFHENTELFLNPINFCCLKLKEHANWKSHIAPHQFYPWGKNYWADNSYYSDLGTNIHGQ